MVKVFSVNKTICLTGELIDKQGKEDMLLVKLGSIDELQIKYDELVNQRQFANICFYHENEALLISKFFSFYRLIEAAGGLVKNMKGEYLFIFRNGKWDLPKGKIEKGESVETAAIREVEEECGIGKLKIIKEIESTYHIYYLKGKEVLKRTYWFEMNCKDLSALVPQLEEGITEVKWLSKNNLNQVLENTYESVKEVMDFIS